MITELKLKEKRGRKSRPGELLPNPGRLERRGRKSRQEIQDVAEEGEVQSK